MYFIKHVDEYYRLNICSPKIHILNLNAQNNGIWRWHLWEVRTQWNDQKNISNQTPRASLVAQMVKNLPAMQETQVQPLGQEDPLEKGMAMHSSILAWRIPWTEESGGLQSVGLQRVRHAWVTNAIYVCKNTDTIQFFIRQLTEFLLTMPCETLMKVNIKCPSKGLSLIPYNFINLNPSKDQIFQFISAIY